MLDRPELAYTAVTDKQVERAVEAVKEAASENGFRVLAVHDVKATLAQKGFEIEGLSIVEICSAPHTDKMLKIDKNISLMMPCKINVYSDGGVTRISGLRPTVLAKLFADLDLSEDAAGLDNIIVRIVDRAAR